MTNKTCPICYENIYSGLGKGCKMCAMPLEDQSKEFCCKECRIKYEGINKKHNQKNFLISKFLPIKIHKNKHEKNI